MFNKQDEKQPVRQNDQRAQMPPIPEVYANAAQANVSPYEFEVTLGLGSSNYEGVRPVINMRMSPQFAKEFARILAENVKLYEEHYGVIKTPEPQRAK